MKTLLQLNCIFVRKIFVRFVAALLLSMLIVVGIVGPHSAYACTGVDLTVHNDTSGQTNYVRLTYKGTDGNPKDHVLCQSVPALNWQDLNIQAALGQTMWLRYFHSSACNPSSQFLSVGLPVPAQTNAAGCWFNPDNINSPNWSGCVNPSQTLTFSSGDTVNIS
jgi:hypothetical protein